MYKKLWLMFVATMLPAWVAAQEMAPEKPAETVDMIYVIIFGVIFLGMIVGFFIYLWINERKQKKGGDSKSAG
jgi:heme/copper-type cytochrome/quinol oxidase subunit 4